MARPPRLETRPKTSMSSCNLEKKNQLDRRDKERCPLLPIGQPSSGLCFSAEAHGILLSFQLLEPKYMLIKVVMNISLVFLDVLNVIKPV